MILKKNYKSFKYIYDFVKRYYFSKGEVYENGRYKKRREECDDEHALFLTEILYKKKIVDLNYLYEAIREEEEAIEEIKKDFPEYKSILSIIQENKLHHIANMRESIDETRELEEKLKPLKKVIGIPKEIPLKKKVL